MSLFTRILLYVIQNQEIISTGSTSDSWILLLMQQAFQKLNLYCQSGIIPTINLITTYETKEQPLTSQAIENIIQEYFVF